MSHHGHEHVTATRGPRVNGAVCSFTSVNQIRVILPFGLCIRSADQQRPNIVMLTSRLTLLPIFFIWFWYCSSLFPI